MDIDIFTSMSLGSLTSKIIAAKLFLQFCVVTKNASEKNS